MTDFAKIKFSAFFDRANVIARMDKKTQYVLAITGLEGRKVMRRGMKSGGRGRNKRYSRPGEYPRYHWQGPNGGLRGVFFAAEPSRKAVVVGPTLFPANARNNVPQTVNEGGTITTIRTERVAEKLAGRRRLKRSATAPKNTRVYRSGGKIIKQTTIAARPFVALTLPATANKMRELMARVKL